MAQVRKFVVRSFIVDSDSRSSWELESTVCVLCWYTSEEAVFGSDLVEVLCCLTFEVDLVGKFFRNRDASVNEVSQQDL